VCRCARTGKRWLRLSRVNDTERARRDKTNKGKTVGTVASVNSGTLVAGARILTRLRTVFIARPVATYSPDYLSLALRKGVCPENERAMTRVRSDAGNGETAYASLCGMVARSLSRDIDRVG